jgi:hypothetical protein
MNFRSRETLRRPQGKNRKRIWERRKRGRRKRLRRRRMEKCAAIMIMTVSI